MRQNETKRKCLIPQAFVALFCLICRFKSFYFGKATGADLTVVGPLVPLPVNWLFVAYLTKGSITGVNAESGWSPEMSVVPMINAGVPLTPIAVPSVRSA